MSERIYAVIEAGTVANAIVADEDFAEIIKDEHDEVLEITDLEPRPGIGWGYDESDGSFTEPPAPEEPPAEEPPAEEPA